MSKEETPITEYEFYKEFETNLRSINYSDKSGNNLLMEWFRQSLEQYAQAKVLEALEPIETKLKKGLEYYERQVNKALERGEVDNVEGRSAVICKQFLKQIETEVKPKYE
jgi:hypothetical protein